MTQLPGILLNGLSFLLCYWLEAIVDRAVLNCFATALYTIWCCHKFLGWTFCSECPGQGNEFELIPTVTRRPASADRTARPQFQVTGQPVILQTRREYRRPSWVAYVDFRSAFDSIDRQSLWLLRSKGIPDKILELLEDLYSNTLRGSRCLQESVRAVF